MSESISYNEVIFLFQLVKVPKYLILICTLKWNTFVLYEEYKITYRMYFRHILNATSNHQSALFFKKMKAIRTRHRGGRKKRIFKKIKLTPIWWNRKRILIHVMIDESAVNRTGRLEFTIYTAGDCYLEFIRTVFF